jgi:hypothetical protein
MVLPLIVRAAPFFAKGAAALKKGKKLKDMGMADVVDAPILRIAGEAAKKSKGTSVASKAATAAVGAAALADAASTPKPKAEAKGRRGGVAPSGSTARENAAPKITPKAAPKTELLVKCLVVAQKLRTVRCLLAKQSWTLLRRSMVQIKR